MWQLRTASLLLFAIISAVENTQKRGPQFVIGEVANQLYLAHHLESHIPQDNYRAYVKENSREVFVEPPIRVTFNGDTPSKDDDICEYKIVPVVRNGKAKGDLHEAEHRQKTALDYENDEDDYEDDENMLPFSIRPSKENNHEAVLEVNGHLNCEHKSSFQFDILAVSCSGGLSSSATVNVTIEDVNEFSPKFGKTVYETAIQEDRIPGPIVKVEAFDEDCSERFNKVVRYEITEPINSPFRVDNNGTISSLRTLNYTQEKQFALTIIAYDVDGKKSAYPATVLIQVAPSCVPQWTGISAGVDFSGDLSHVALFPKATLKLCEISGCKKVEKISGHVTLQNNHIGKGCDREERLPLPVQHKRCSTRVRPNTSLIELLAPQASSDPETQPKVDGNNTDSTNRHVYAFDGVKTAVVVATEKLNPDTFNRSFTITTWLKRDAPANRTQDHKYPKEHILCISDDHERSRHHVALYIRNCRLGLLLRREPHHGDALTVFRPAEWRWNLDEQLCNNQWHHYAVSVKYPDVKLFIDGKEFINDAETEIIDDWALHPIKGMQTTSVIGACWQGAQKKMDQYFHGYLDSLSVLVNATEEESVLDCMQKCAERLTVPASKASSDPDQSVYSMLDDDENEMLVEGHTVESFQEMVRQVSYENSRLYPTPGLRFAHLKTSITCVSSGNNQNQKVTKELPEIKLDLNVQETIPPSVTISGPASLTIDGMDKSESELASVGVKILDSLTISVMRSGSQTENPDYESMVKRISRDEVVLDSCTVSLKQEEQESNLKLQLSDSLMQSLKMSAIESVQEFQEKYLMIEGGGNEIPDYLSVLRDVRLVILGGRKTEQTEQKLKVSVVCREMATKTYSSKYLLQVILKDLQPLHQLDLQVVPAVHLQPKAHIVETSHHLSVANPIISPVTGLSHDFSDVYGPHSVFSFPQFHGGDSAKLTTAGAAITIVVIVCISFFIFLVFVSVVKIRQVQKINERNVPSGIGNGAKPKRRTLSLKNLRKTFVKRQQEMTDDFGEEDDDIGDVEQGLTCKKSDMVWDDSGMSITVNPLESMQTGSDCEYEDDDVECDEDGCQNGYVDEDGSEEEKENDDCHHQQFDYQDDNDSANECEECTKPNRECPLNDLSIRRSQSCSESFSNAANSRMTKSELEWDDQI